MKNKYGWSFIGEPFNENFFRTTNSFLEIGDDVDKLKLVDFEDISELKGIFSRPINKDTPDFNRVWEYLGKPKPDYLQIVIDTLYKLRHCMRENDWPSANAFYGALNNVEFREMVKIFRDQLLRHQHELISRYFFKELAYQKDSMLVIAVIKDYVHYNPSITYNQLENIFPRSLQRLKHS